MPRNKERDAREAELRKKKLFDAGFELFSAEGIESVSLQAVADAAGVGIATMYNYFTNKVNFVIFMSASIWKNVLNEDLKKFSSEELEKINAYEFISHYIDVIIELYRKQPNILRFSANYKTFVRREGASYEQLGEQLNELAPIETMFYKKYEEAKIDKSIRTDIPAKELYTTIALTPLCMAERYAQGIVWADDHTDDHLKELLHLKEMILDWCTK